MKDDINNLKLAIGRNLKKFRRAKSLTQNDLAQAINEKVGSSYSGNAVSSWEMGRNSMSIELLFVIASILEVEIQRFQDQSQVLKDDELDLLDQYYRLDREEQKQVLLYVEFLLWKRDHKDEDSEGPSFPPSMT